MNKNAQQPRVRGRFAAKQKIAAIHVVKPACNGLPGTILCEDRTVAKTCCGLHAGECVSNHQLANEKQPGHPKMTRIAYANEVIQMVTTHA